MSVTFFADSGEIMVGARVACYTYGRHNVILPEGKELAIDDYDTGYSDGYIYRPPEHTEFDDFDFAFVQADIEVDVNALWSDFEAVIDEAQKKVAEDVYFDADIEGTGLGRYKFGKHYKVGDIVRVGILGGRRYITAPVTQVTHLPSGELRVHVGGQAIRDLGLAEEQNRQVRQAIAKASAQNRQQLSKVSATAAEAIGKAGSALAAAEKVESFDSRISEASDAVQSALDAVAELNKRLDEGVDTSRFDELMADHATKLDDLAAALAAFEDVDAERRAALVQLGADLRAASDAVREVEDAVRDNATRFAGFERRQEDADKKLDSLALESGMLQAGNLVWNPHGKENMAGWLFNTLLSGTYFATGGVTTERVRVKWNGTPVQKNIDFGYPDTQTYFPIAPNQEFLCTIWVRPTVQLPAGAMRLDFSGASTVSSPVLPANAWTKIEGVIKVNSNNTAKRSWLRLVHTTSIPATAEWDICNPSVVEMAGEVLVVDGAITARKIGAGEITANHIKSGEITSDILTVRNGFIKSAMIGAGEIKTANIDNAAITTAKIGNLAVKTGNIDNLAVTDAKIGSLNAGKIDAGYLNAGRINTGSLHGNKITANTLTAKEIAANTITGNEIAANSIMANKLQITAGNLFPDPHFKDPSWTGGNSNARIGTANGGELQLHASGVQTGQYYWPTGGSKDKDITLEAGAAYRISMGCYASSNADQKICDVYMRYLHTDNTVKIQLLGNIENIGAHGRRSINFTTPTTMKNGLCTIGFFTRPNMTVGNINIWDVQLVRAADSLLIVDGAIQAQHIDTGSITTNHIATAGISAGVIKTGTMSADRISGGTIDGKLIRAGTLDATKVNADEIFLKADGDLSLSEQWEDLMFAMQLQNSAVSYLSDKVFSLEMHETGFFTTDGSYSGFTGSAQAKGRFSNDGETATGSWRGRCLAVSLNVTSTRTELKSALTEITATNRNINIPYGNGVALVWYEVDPLIPVPISLTPSSNQQIPQSAWTTITGMTATAPGTGDVNISGKIVFTNVHRGSTYGVRILAGSKEVFRWESAKFGPLTSLGNSTWSVTVSANASISSGQQLAVQAYCSNSTASKRTVTTSSAVSGVFYY